jgi:hypothetical protein
VKHSLPVLFFCSILAWSLPNSPEYNISIHVNASRMVREGNSSAYHQNLSVLIDGKKCELESFDATNTLLMLGDYKARLVKQHHGGDYDVWLAYEFQLPDKRTRQFLLVGQME